MAFNKGNLKSGKRKLTPMDVLDIRRRYGIGESQASLCREYQVTVGTIGRIVRGESWQGYPQIETDFDIEKRMVRQAVPPSQEEIAKSLEKLRDLGLEMPRVQLTPDVVAEDSPGVRRFQAEMTRQSRVDRQLDELTKGDDDET